MGTESWKIHYTCIFIQAAFFYWSKKKVRKGNDWIKTNLPKLQKIVAYESLWSYLSFEKKVQCVSLEMNIFQIWRNHVFEFGARFFKNTTADQAYHKTSYQVSVVFYFIRANLIHHVMQGSYKVRKYEFDVKNNSRYFS